MSQSSKKQKVAKFRLAIIDDGVNKNNLGIALDLENDLEVVDGSVRERSSYDTYAHSHGTTCIGIISSYFTSFPCTVSSIKILSKHHRGSVDDMLIALNWCREHGIKVINMSIGTRDFTARNRLKTVVNEMAAEGIVIVAAEDNNGYFTYPAAFTNVIGVKALQNMLNDGILLNGNVGIDGIDFLAKAEHDVWLAGEKIKTSLSNSFATPYVTVQVLQLLDRDVSLDVQNIKNLLRTRMTDQIVCQPNFFDWSNEYFLCNFSSLLMSEALHSRNIVTYTQINQDEILLTHFYPSEFTKNSTLVITCDRLGVDKDLDVLSPYFSIYKNVILLDIKRNNIKFLSGLLSSKRNREEDGKDSFQIGIDSFNFCALECNQSRNNKSVEVPVVALHSCHLDGLVRIMLEIKDYFFTDGFNCLCLLDSALGYLCDFLVYNQRTALENVLLNHLSTIYMADLILIGSHSYLNEPSVVSTDETGVDLFFHLGKGSCSMKFLETKVEFLDLGNLLEHARSYVEHVSCKIIQAFG